MMARIAIFVSAIVTILRGGVAYPSGAPTSACSDFMPNHGKAVPQFSPSPYEVNLSQFAVASSFVYEPGKQYNVTLHSSSGNTPFKGFLLQAHSAYNNAIIQGTFSNLPNETRYLSCSAIVSNATVTHNNTNKNDFYSLTFTWTAPAYSSGPLRFRFTVVQAYSTFWSEIRSDIIQESTNGYLLLANVVAIRTVNLDGSNLKTLTLNPVNVLDTSFHYRNNFVYWADYALTAAIKRSELNGDNIETVVHNNLLVPSSVAVDWINDKLYWCDENASRIEVADLSGDYRKVLVDTDIQHPSNLVVDPNTRYVYWADWGLGRIERISLDGTSRRLIHSTDLNETVGLTIDYEKQVLYWIDSLADKIEVSSVNGKNRQTLVNSSNFLANARELAYFNGTLYWAEKKGKSLYSTDVNDPQMYEQLLSDLLYEVHSVEVVHPLSQKKAPNPCETNNGGCQQLCLLSATSFFGYSCACADGFLPANHDSSRCTAASTYEVTFCLAGTNNIDCNSWTTDWLENDKMFKIAQSLVNGVRSICYRCSSTFTSGNLLSTQNSTLTCPEHNSSLIKFHGYIYGYSTIDDSLLLSSIDLWTNSKPFITVFQDEFRVNTEESCNSTTADGLSQLAIAGILGGTIFGSICICSCFIYLVLSNKSCNESSSKNHRSSLELRSVRKSPDQPVKKQPVEQPTRNPTERLTSQKPKEQPDKNSIGQPIKKPAQQLTSQNFKEETIKKSVQHPVKKSVGQSVVKNPVQQPVRQSSSVQLQNISSRQNSDSGPGLLAMEEIRVREGPGGIKMAVKKNIIIDPVNQLAIEKEVVLLEGGGTVAIGQGPVKVVDLRK